MVAWKNQLFFGDNLEILRSGRIPVESVDLIYLDLSFNSNATYNILFAERAGLKTFKGRPDGARERNNQGEFNL